MTPEDLRELLIRADPPQAASALLGRSLEVRDCAATIVEVEAYGSDRAGPWPDPASHAYPGRTGRNPVMFGPAGRLYVYRIYGMHLCANVSFGPDGHAGAVLLRAAALTTGVERARVRRRAGVAPSGLASGPANLVQALGITLDDQGTDVISGDSGVTLSITQFSGDIHAGPRVGVSKAADRQWRFWFEDHPAVSRYRRHTRATTD
ncbi:DNA-3-methyladenine glycosylase [Hoyosella sp. YIM 151337]|uniref:DNA-3-methyladenine glycosylase n=1 Tax=Hoyosella sp. YIM 151337 TaxID=2992742 RepID=UPI002235576C|nr:DNA-3-methyladenine glycosylase [Hoyosella sp. YIM 151337]MCW4355649.1 DNA-3-methyladenine glycosylase [Hoyosella sp. YIM 151337]